MSKTDDTAIARKRRIELRASAKNDDEDSSGTNIPNVDMDCSISSWILSFTTGSLTTTELGRRTMVDWRFFLGVDVCNDDTMMFKPSFEERGCVRDLRSGLKSAQITEEHKKPESIRLRTQR